MSEQEVAIVNKRTKTDDDIALRIFIQDYEELKTVRQFSFFINKLHTVADTLHKIATKGNVQIIASNFSYGEANFELAQNDKVLPKQATLQELIDSHALDISQLIALRKKVREGIELKFEIENFQELKCARTVNTHNYKDQTVQETIHKIARKGSVFIPVAEEPDYGLFYNKEAMDGNRTLESYKLADKTVLQLKKKNEMELKLVVNIEDYMALGTPRTTSCRLRRDITVKEALKRIATMGKINIPENHLPYFDLYILVTNEKMEKTNIIGNYPDLKNEDGIILRKIETVSMSEFTTSDNNNNKSEDIRIDPSEIKYTEKVGQGSSAKVLKGEFRGREVAIKQLKEAPGDDRYQTALREFQYEVDILRHNYCQNIVKFYGIIEQPKLCIVMELCAKGSLYHVMNNVVYDFWWDRTFKFALEMCVGLSFLHSQNPQILHRDLKSLNLLVTENFELKICDFGLSRFRTPDHNETLRKLRGTAVWSAPEILREVEYSAKSDIYSIGIILWELIYRCVKGKYQRPFAEYKELMFDYQILVAAGKGMRPKIPDVTPPSLATLIKSCWSGAPEERPTTDKIIEQLTALQKDYEKNPRAWDKIKEENNPTQTLFTN